MATISSTVKSRAASQATSNNETHSARVVNIYKDGNGNVTSADVQVQGQGVTMLRSVPNASGLAITAGMSVIVNFRRGARFVPQIIGTSGAAAGAVLSSAASAAANQQFGNTSSTTDLSGIPFLLESPDDSVPDAFVVSPGSNILFEEFDGGDTSGGTQNPTLEINMRVLVTTALPGVHTSGLPDGTLADLVNSYGISLGMYRLDLSLGAWVRRDIGIVPTFVDHEVPAGTVNGTNPTFTLATAPSPVASLYLWVGAYDTHLYLMGATAYSLSGNTITFTTPPANGSKIYASYRH